MPHYKATPGVLTHVPLLEPADLPQIKLPEPVDDETVVRIMIPRIEKMLFRSGYELLKDPVSFAKLRAFLDAQEALTTGVDANT